MPMNDFSECLSRIQDWDVIFTPTGSREWFVHTEL